MDHTLPMGTRLQLLHVCLQGGESRGLQRLARFVKDTEYICSFEKPKGNPAKFQHDTPATTVLSPYVKFGCVSVRRFYWQVGSPGGTPVGREGPGAILSRACGTDTHIKLGRQGLW